MKTAKPLLLAFTLGAVLVTSLRADPGNWVRVGKGPDWQGTIAVAVLNNSIYTVEENGGLFRTNASTGEWVKIGAATFGHTKFMFALGGWLFTIESDGSLYRVDAEDGSWQQVGAKGAWFDTIAGATSSLEAKDGVLLTAESSGRLYATSPSDGSRRQVGKADFANVGFMFLADRWLYTIEVDGSLYQVHPANGNWSRVGTAGAWKGTIAGALLNDRVYTVEKDGGLYETDPSTGRWQQLGKAEFGNTKFMVAVAGSLYTIENDGGLYRIDAGHDQPAGLPPANIHHTHSKMDVTLLDGDRFKAVISYLDKEGNEKTRSFDGTKEEIRKWLTTIPDLLADDLDRMQRWLDMAGRPRVIPDFPRSPLRPGPTH